MLLIKRHGLIVVLCAVMVSSSFAHPSRLFNSNEDTYKNAQTYLKSIKNYKINDNKATNVILFIGDGMSFTTVTASRIYAGQQKGGPGENHRLAMESLPDVAISKTYNIDMQTPDSAGTGTAMTTGHKTNSGMIGVSHYVKRGQWKYSKDNHVKTAFEYAAGKGMSIGIVTTTSVTDATPASAYAHTSERYWETDADLPDEAARAGYPDIAKQFVNFDYGKGFQVIFGGGKASFLTKNKGGKRNDTDLLQVWKSRYPELNIVTEKEQMASVQPSSEARVLGLFADDNMSYQLDKKENSTEPTLEQMTSKAIDILSKNPKGYLLMVEGGLIDDAHHSGNAKKAMVETIEFDKALQTALDKTNPQETLIIVTADHSHGLAMVGDAKRGNPILGLSRKKLDTNKDVHGEEYTTLHYLTGPGTVYNQSFVTELQAQGDDYKQTALIPLVQATHSGEDVMISARGPKSWLFKGFVEQNYIFHVINAALDLTQTEDI